MDLLFLNQHHSRRRRVRQIGRVDENALRRQDKGDVLVKRESWSEQDILDLPPEESDDFDRKGGRLFDEVEDKVLTTIAKALSAFANSGGGSLVLGVKDDGSIDGIPSMKGRATIRDWFEQKVPHLLDYPLADFRVHTVLRGVQSQIPIGREIIVIDVGDSAAAPHQSARDQLYYHRQGGRSVPAKHFYLDLLRQRLTHPVLTLGMHSIQTHTAQEFNGGIYFIVNLTFVVRNIGRIAAHEWAISLRNADHPNDGFFGRHRLVFEYEHEFQIPYSSGRIELRQPILPGRGLRQTRPLGFPVFFPVGGPVSNFTEAVEERFKGTMFHFQLATEFSAGEISPLGLEQLMPVQEMAIMAVQTVPHYFSL